MKSILTISKRWNQPEILHEIWSQEENDVRLRLSMSLPDFINAVKTEMGPVMKVFDRVDLSNRIDDIAIAITGSDLPSMANKVKDAIAPISLTFTRTEYNDAVKKEIHEIINKWYSELDTKVSGVNSESVDGIKKSIEDVQNKLNKILSSLSMAQHKAQPTEDVVEDCMGIIEKRDTDAIEKYNKEVIDWITDFVERIKSGIGSVTWTLTRDGFNKQFDEAVAAIPILEHKTVESKDLKEQLKEKIDANETMHTAAFNTENNEWFRDTMRKLRTINFIIDVQPATEVRQELPIDSILEAIDPIADALIRAEVDKRLEDYIAVTVKEGIALFIKEMKDKIDVITRVFTKEEFEDRMDAAIATVIKGIKEEWLKHPF